MKIPEWIESRAYEFADKMQEQMNEAYLAGYEDAVSEYERKHGGIKSGDVVYNMNNRCNALVLHVMPDGKSAQVAEFNPKSDDGIMIHCPPIAAFEKLI